jgi:hexosaminidase
VLAPGQPGSIALIKQEFTELAAEYPGPFLHIGADETVDLGLGQTKADVDARGLAPVYLDFMQQIVTALKPLHRGCCSGATSRRTRPDLLKALPQSFKDSTIAIAWGTTRSPRATQVPDAVHQRRLRDLGLAQREQLPRGLSGQQLALYNIQEFTRDGQKLGSTGS